MDIQTDIPIPDDVIRAGRPALYPFLELGVGHSFAVPAIDAVRLGAAAKQWKRRHPGWDYKTRKSGNEIRIWRTA